MEVHLNTDLTDRCMVSRSFVTHCVFRDPYNRKIVCTRAVLNHTEHDEGQWKESPMQNFDVSKMIDAWSSLADTVFVPIPNPSIKG